MAKKNNINSDTGMRKARKDLYSSTELLLLDAKDVFKGLKGKYIKATNNKSEGMQISDEKVDRVAKKIISKHRKAFEELSK
ncbi:hypothetical protein [Tepidanaerobacter syntrophicus]|uniref:Uncharacterized protein n=1 Tax=Tepidanaerobacter syntrophicus TaxID=224999 RepID=A0A0U9HG80_9FIRM|nr:hypothetical protein [Tepidanaerobacter syntrophicus]GAQ25690.1 hypothetical protein TSYNT_8227 [Tepidanaerobacter syntrophicus]